MGADRALSVSLKLFLKPWTTLSQPTTCSIHLLSAADAELELHLMPSVYLGKAYSESFCLIRLAAHRDAPIRDITLWLADSLTIAKDAHGLVGKEHQCPTPSRLDAVQRLLLNASLFHWWEPLCDVAHHPADSTQTGFFWCLQDWWNDASVHLMVGCRRH